MLLWKAGVKCTWYCVRRPDCLAIANTQRPRAVSDLDPSKEWRSQEHYLRRVYWPLHLLLAPGSLLWKRNLLTPRPANQVLSTERGPQPNSKKPELKRISVHRTQRSSAIMTRHLQGELVYVPCWVEGIDSHTGNSSTNLESCLQSWHLHPEIEA